MLAVTGATIGCGGSDYGTQPSETAWSAEPEQAEAPPPHDTRPEGTSSKPELAFDLGLRWAMLLGAYVNDPSSAFGIYQDAAPAGTQLGLQLPAPPLGTQAPGHEGLMFVLQSARPIAATLSEQHGPRAGAAFSYSFKSLAAHIFAADPGIRRDLISQLDGASRALDLPSETHERTRAMLSGGGDLEALLGHLRAVRSALAERGASSDTAPWLPAAAAEAVPPTAVDYSRPEAVVQAIFDAARTDDPSLLRGPCHPSGRGDGDTRAICSLRREDPEYREFISYFRHARILEPAVVTGSRARVNFVFGPELTRQETMNLVMEGGRWYLASF